MKLTPIENLKSFATNRPPLMIFMICMSAFAIILVSLAYIIKVNEIKNHDLSQDWNVFLESFSELQFCVTGNATDPNSPPQVTEKTPEKVDVVIKGAADKHANKQLVVQNKPANANATEENRTSDIIFENTRNYSVSLLITIHPSSDFLRIPHNVTHLYGTVTGDQLGLRGAALNQEVNITFALPFDWNSTKCDKEGKCDPVQIYTCVNFQAAPSVFPVTRKPLGCYGVNETGVEYHAHLEAHKDLSFFNYYRCKSQTKIRVHYDLNPTLTVMLSLHDRSLINLHLMHTSYFLFVMVVTMFCYALLKGRPSKPKYQLVPREDEEHSSTAL
ncbi:transmembrane protein 248-like isoform X2 [Lineus longissimus]